MSTKMDLNGLLAASAAAVRFDMKETFKELLACGFDPSEGVFVVRSTVEELFSLQKVLNGIEAKLDCKSFKEVVLEMDCADLLDQIKNGEEKLDKVGSEKPAKKKAFEPRLLTSRVKKATQFEQFLAAAFVVSQAGTELFTKHNMAELLISQKLISDQSISGLQNQSSKISEAGYIAKTEEKVETVVETVMGPRKGKRPLWALTPKGVQYVLARGLITNEAKKD